MSNLWLLDIFVLLAFLFSFLRSFLASNRTELPIDEMGEVQMSRLLAIDDIIGDIGLIEDILNGVVLFFNWRAIASDSASLDLGK